MAWTSGGVQSGTDTSLSGLSGVTGVTTFSLPTSITVYRVPSLLTINGTLSWDPNSEWLWSVRGDGSEHVIINGSLTIDGEITGNGDYDKQQPGLLFTGSRESSLNSNNADIRLNSGGSISCTGIKIEVASHLYFDSGSTASFVRCSIQGSEDAISASSSRRIRNYIESTFNECLFNGIQIDQFAPASLILPRWVSTYNASQVISAVSGGSSSIYELSGIEIESSVIDLDNFAGSKLTLKNTDQGSLFLIEHLNHKNSGNALVSAVDGSASKIVNTISFAIQDTSNAGIEDASVYLRDTNNDNRANTTYQDASSENFVDDRTHYETSNGSGIFPDIDLLCYVIRGGRSVGASSDPVYDFRGVSGDESNDFLPIFSAYGFLPIQSTIEAYGVNGGKRVIRQSLLTDGKITESDDAIVAGYTSGLSNISPDQIYDYSAYEKTLEAGIEQPNSNATRWAEDGDSLVLIDSSYELIISADASGILINHSTKTITIPQLVAGTTFDGGVSATNVRLSSATSYSVPVVIPGAGTINIDDAPSEVDLTAWSFADGAAFEITDGGSTTITVASSALATQLDADKLETSGTIAFVAPPTTVQVTVTGPSDYYVTVEQSGSRLNTSDTGLQSGVYSFETSATGSATVRVRKQGWTRFETSVDLSGAVVGVNARLAQLTGAQGNPLYTGDTNSAITVTIDTANDAAHRIDWTDNAETTVQVIFNAIEDAAVANDGMGVVNLSATYTRFRPYLEGLTLPIQVELRNQTAANQNCILTGFVSHAAGTPVDGSGSNGTVQVVSSVGLSIEDIFTGLLSSYSSTAGSLAEALQVLFNATTSGTGATVFSTTALANAPAGGGGGDATEAKQDAILATLGTDGDGLTSIPWNAAWDAEVQSEVVDGLVEHTAPTTAEFNARTLASTAYFDPASDTVARVTLVDTTTANTDMRGTDGALTAIGSVTVGAVSADAITADSIAAGAVTKIQAGLATTTNITNAQTAILAGGFVASDRTALLAIAYGRQDINYTTSTFTQYDTGGSPLQVFDLYQEDATTAATSAQQAQVRIPQ